MVVETLGSRLAAQDAARFVGRSAELARLTALLTEVPSVNVVLVHGPAGVGKSTLMREFARRAALRGWEPVAIEARDLTPLSSALESALRPAFESPRPLLLLDTWERMTALDGYLRARVLSRLGGRSIVVVATRNPPASGWFAGGWEHLVLDLRLGPLEPRDAEALLAARGLADPVKRTAAISWAQGSPLALVLAADAGGVPAGTRADDAPSALVGPLLQRLLDAQPEGEHRMVLGMAALARVTTPELLQKALPGVEPQSAFEWLRRQPGAEPLRDGLTLHELVGRAVRADLRRHSPELERQLRRRIVDALYASSAPGGLLQLTLDLQHLVQDPAIRWGFAWDTSGRYRIDAPRPTDLDEIVETTGRAGRLWLESASRYFREAWDRVTVVRDQDDAIAGYGISVTPANVPSWAADDPVLGPRVRHAARHVAGGRAVVCRQAVDLTRVAASPVVGLIGMGAVIGSGLENPAAAYLPIPREDRTARAFSEACGARPLDELAAVYAGVHLECHVLDYGPGGLLAFQRAAVYRELGLPAPAPTLDALKQTLRDYGSPARLAASPLASVGGPPAQRAAYVRELIDRAVRDAFGPSAEDQRLRRVLMRGYLDPAPTHEVAARELNLSRTGYFRALRAAVARVALELDVPGT